MRFVQKTLNLEEFNDWVLVSAYYAASLEKDQVLYYVQAKEKRRKASYSTQKNFTKLEVENMQRKAISFVNKTKEIIILKQSTD